MKKVTLIFVLCAVIALSAAAQTRWEPLFNNKNFKGWTLKGGNAEFRIENGEIVGVARAYTPSTFLCTQKMYGDFILEMEVLMNTTLNSGIQFRSLARPDERVGERVYGYQYELDPSPRAWTGGIYDEARRAWLYTLRENPQAQKAYRHGEWNRVRIEAIGNTIRTWINDIPASDILDDMTAAGFIALQVHSVKDPSWAGYQTRWRNLRICTSDLDRERTPYMNGVAQINYIDNTISDREASEGWKLLFDGQSMNQWVSPKTGEFPTQGYDVEDGVLIVNKTPGQGGGDIMTRERYKNFAFKFDFYLTPGANNGIKYLYQTEVAEKNTSYKGPEYQILDDKLHPDSKLGVVPRCRQCAALYDVMPPEPMDNKTFKGVSEWNTGMIVVNDGVIEHHMNGVKVLEVDRFSYAYEVLRSLSKFTDAERFGQFTDGHLLITDHADKVMFKNLKIKEL